MLQETEIKALIDLVMRDADPTETGRRLDRPLSKEDVEEVVGHILMTKSENSKLLEDSHIKRKVMVDLGTEYSQGVVDVQGLVLGLIQIAGRDAVVSAFSDVFPDWRQRKEPLVTLQQEEQNRLDESEPADQDQDAQNPEEHPQEGQPQPEVVAIKRCENCGTTSTPLWRKDRHVNMLLCNACGIYYKNHGRHRPVELAAAGARGNGERGASGGGMPSGGKGARNKTTAKKRNRPAPLQQDFEVEPDPDRRRSTRYRKPSSYLLASDDEFDEYDEYDDDEDDAEEGYGHGDGESSEPSKWAGWAGMASGRWNPRAGNEGTKTVNSEDSQGRRTKHRRRESALEKEALEQSKSDLSSVECVPSSASIPPSPPPYSRFDLVKDDAIAEKLRVQLIDRLVSTFVNDTDTRGSEEGAVESAVWSLASLKRARLMDPATGATWGKVRLYADPPYNNNTYSNKGAAKSSSSYQQVCDNCGTTSTPLWRKDRDSGQVLCNACGIYLKTHGRHRPIGTSRHKIPPPPQAIQDGNRAFPGIFAPKTSFKVQGTPETAETSAEGTGGAVGADEEDGAAQVYHPATLLTPAIRGARLSRPPRPPSAPQTTTTLPGLPLAPPPPPPPPLAGVTPNRVVSQQRPSLPQAPALFKASQGIPFSQPYMGASTQPYTSH